MSRIKVLSVVVMSFACPWTAWSEETPSSPLRPYAYGSAAGGACNHGYTIAGGGGGGEFFPFRRLGIGGDFVEALGGARPSYHERQLGAAKGSLARATRFFWPLLL
jgi:hypothetical protein